MSHLLYPAYRLNRHRLLLSCATVAIATAALAPQRASAQAFQGTPTATAGTVTFSRSTPGSETVTVGSSTATINWAPSDSQGTGHVNFLPEGNTATYQGAAGLTNYTVLNRIVPTDATRAIELNGSVLSKLDGGATGGIGSIIVDSYSGSIKILGNVRYINAGPSDSLTLDSGKAVEVDTDTASYVMTGPSGNLAGSLISIRPTSGSGTAPFSSNSNRIPILMAATPSLQLTAALPIRLGLLARAASPSSREARSSYRTAGLPATWEGSPSGMPAFCSRMSKQPRARSPFTVARSSPTVPL